MSKARFNNLSDLLNNINIPVHEIRDAVALADTNSQRITDHENGTDPHPQYYNQARGDSRYIQITTLEQPNGVATLDSNAKIKFNQIPDAALGGLSYQGSWNANTNTPSLFSGQGTRGYFYKVSVQGSTDLDGITDWKIGDWVIFDGAAWQKLDQTEIIQSVNNKTGDVVLDTDDISEGITNLYFTNQRASDAAPVQTVYGRIGVVVAEDGDYSASQVVFDASSSDLVNTRVQSAIVELNTKTNTHINDNGDPHPQYTTTTEAANAAPVQSVDGQTGNVVLNYDNYGGWELRTDGVSRGNIDSGEAVNFVGGSNITLSYSATNNTVTISATNITDTNFYLDGLSFNTADGILTASVNGAADQTVDLDGRYLLSTDKAADSDLLDGLDSTDFYRKRQTLTSSDDLDTITQEGLYGWNASIPTNAPNNQPYCSMFVTNDGAQAIQYVFGSLTGNAWVRRANSGVFGAFTRLYSDSYHPNADTLTTARQIALSGDVSGSANFDGSANIDINVSVADDSHNHTIDNVDGLQTALDDIDAKQLRESLLKEATLNLDFANNNYEIYEGPVNSLTGRPFNDIVTFTRSSVANARNAIGGLTPVGVDDHRLVGNREGLLIEESRTNVLLHSEKFDDPIWAKTGVSITTNATTAPDGIVSADKIVESSGINETHQVHQIVSSTAGQKRTTFFFVKAAEIDTFLIRRYSLFTDVVSVTFNLGNKTVSDPAGSLTELNNGWFLASVSYNVVTTGDAGYILRLREDSSYTGDGTSGLYVWGAQDEVGSFPTSYIKTEGTQVTRSADNASVDDLSNWFNMLEGAFIVDVESLKDSGLSWILETSTRNPEVFFSHSAGTITAQSSTIGTTSLPFSGSRQLVAVSFNNNRLLLSVGGSISEVLGDFTPSGTGLRLGRNVTNNDRYLAGQVKSLRYIPRALSSTELQALTSGE